MANICPSFHSLHSSFRFNFEQDIFRPHDLQCTTHQYAILCTRMIIQPELGFPFDVKQPNETEVIIFDHVGPILYPR